MPDKENFQHYQHLAAQSHHPQFNFWPHPTPFHAAQSAAAAAAAASGMSSHQHNPFAQYYASNPGHHPFAGTATTAPTALSANPMSSSTSLSAQKYGHSPFFPSMAGAAPNAGHLNHPAFGLSPTSGAIPPANAGCSSKWGPTAPYHGQHNGVPSSAFSAFQGNDRPSAETIESSASKVNKFNGFSSGSAAAAEPVTMIREKSPPQHQQQGRKKSAVEVMDIDVVHAARSEDGRPEDNNKKSKSKG